MYGSEKVKNSFSAKTDSRRHNLTSIVGARSAGSVKS